MWQEFTTETGGRFIKREEAWLSDKTEIEYNGWSIYFDNYNITSGKFSQEITRVTAPFVTVDDFRFEIYRSGFIRQVKKIFGAQDIEIGRPKFDKAFIIKANNELKIKTLLQNEKIRSLIEAQKELNLVISDQKGIWESKLPKNELELTFYADGRIIDFEILKSMLSLFQELLDNLEQMDAIKKPDAKS